MPLGPFDPIPPREKIKRAHVNDLREALTGVQDAYDVAVADGFVGTRANWLASLKGPEGNPGPPGKPATLNYLGILPDTASLPASGNTNGDAYTIGAHLWVWDGAAWVDIGDLQGPPGDLSQSLADTLYVGQDAAPAFTALDLWPAFDANGGAGSWNALTYGPWIAGIDSLLSGEISAGRVVKTDLGASSGAARVYSYAAGSGPVNLLIVSGIHGSETLGMWAAMRWFVAFTTSNDPDYRRMRNAYRVTWVPSANPSRYRTSRVNSNGVDINRNYDLLWARYSDGGPTAETYKGTAPASEPETQILVNLIQGGNFRHVIDCHNYSAAGNTVMFGLPGHYLLGPRQFVVDTAAAWQAVYANGATWSQINPIDTFPMLHNWANYRLRHVEGKADSTALVLEASADLFGSVTQQSATQAAMRAYCGMIHTHLLRVLANGFADTAPAFPYTITGYRSAIDLATSITAGGGLIDTGTVTPVTVTWNTGGFTQALATAEIPILAAPAYLYVNVSGALRSTGGSAGRSTIGVSLDGATPSSNQRTTANTTAVSGEYSQFSFGVHQYVAAFNPAALPTVAITAQRNAGGNVEMYNLRVMLSVEPVTESHKTPRLGV